MLLTSEDELPIVRPPFGKSTDFLERIPSNFLNFSKVDPRPVLSTSLLKSKTGNRCRSLTRQRTSDPFERMFKNETSLSPPRRVCVPDDRQRLLLWGVPRLQFVWLSEQSLRLRIRTGLSGLSGGSCLSHLPDVPQRWLWREWADDAARRVLRPRQHESRVADVERGLWGDTGRLAGRSGEAADLLNRGYSDVLRAGLFSLSA
jgi:hypothetical protein